MSGALGLRSSLGGRFFSGLCMNAFPFPMKKYSSENISLTTLTGHLPALLTYGLFSFIFIKAVPGPKPPSFFLNLPVLMALALLGCYIPKIEFSSA